MSQIAHRYDRLQQICKPFGAQIVAVSKKQPLDKIIELYELGHRDFGENRVQDFLAKKDQLPGDIRWHFIGHLQRNKVKELVPHVFMIHSVDSLRLLKEISKQAIKNNQTVRILLQPKIALEEAKTGMDFSMLAECIEAIQDDEYEGVRLKGLMGMATHTDDESLIRNEFLSLKDKFEHYLSQDPSLMKILSMGMTHDYQIALECGANMLRIGSLIFGPRQY